jgi:uncharacterized membrane protein
MENSMRISRMQVLVGAALVAVIAAAVSQPARADDDDDTQTRYAVAWMGTLQCGTTPTATLCPD